MRVFMGRLRRQSISARAVGRDAARKVSEKMAVFVKLFSNGTFTQLLRSHPGGGGILAHGTGQGAAALAGVNVSRGQGLRSGKSTAPGIHPDDPRVDAIWEKAAELHMPISLHVADETDGAVVREAEPPKR